MPSYDADIFGSGALQSQSTSLKGKGHPGAVCQQQKHQGKKLNSTVSFSMVQTC